MNDKYLYYPGCSMESSAKAYSESLMAIIPHKIEQIDQLHAILARAKQVEESA